MDRDELLTELANLRSSHRRTLIIATCSVLAIALLATFDKLRTRAELRSHRFVLVDASGKDIATLRPLDDGACLDLYTPSKVSVVNICSADTLGSYVSLVTRNGETQAVLSTGESIGEAMTSRLPPGLVVATANGERAFIVRLGADLKLTFGDPSGKNGVNLLIPNSAQPVLKVAGEEIFPKSSHGQSPRSSGRRPD